MKLAQMMGNDQTKTDGCVPQSNLDRISGHVWLASVQHLCMEAFPLALECREAGPGERKRKRLIM